MCKTWITRVKKMGLCELFCKYMLCQALFATGTTSYDPFDPNYRPLTTVDIGKAIAGIFVGILLITCLIFCCLKPRSCTIFGIRIVHFVYKWCCFRLDCASTLDPNTAISRYEEDPPLQRDELIREVKSNDYIKSILNSFAILLPEYFLSILPTGSLSEGSGKLLPSTSVLASDFDLMVVPHAVMVGEDGVEYAGNERPVFAAIEQDEIDAGFVWLRLRNDYLKQWENLCLRRQTESVGYSYLSSEKIHTLMRQTFIASEAITRTTERIFGAANKVKLDVERNGPALTVKVVKTPFTCVVNLSFCTCDCTGCCTCWGCCKLRRDDTIFYCDLTFGLHSPQWPKRARGWFSEDRRRFWPSPDIVERIKRIGCHVVPKQSTESVITLHQDQPENTTYSQCSGLEWRYSFSQAELLLSDPRNIPHEARIAFLALKAVNKQYFKRGLLEGQKLASFALKCILYEEMENTEPESWATPHGFIEIFNRLLDRLRQRLVNRRFPHYWIEGMDLFQGLSTDTLDELQHKVEVVRHNPQEHIADNWLEATRWMRKKCCKCCAFGKQQYLHRNMSDALIKQQSKCPWVLIPCSYDDSASCVGPCPYDKINMDVY